MIAHTSLHVSDYARSKAFYLRALEPLRYHNNMEHGEAGGFNVWYDHARARGQR